MNIFKKKTWLLAGFSALCMLYACNDDEYATGLEIHPKNELINIGNDSSQTVNAYTYENENYISVSSSQTGYMFGFCNDPYLGTFQNNVITHVGLSDLKSSFRDSALSLTIDSVVLYLDFNYSDGDTVGKQSISLFELSHNVSVSDLSGVELYEETLNGYYDPNSPLHTFEFQPRRTWNDTASVVSVPLPIEFGERLFVDTIYQGNDTLLPYKNDSIFKAEILNGFYLKANEKQESKCVSNLLMTDSTSLQVFYRKVYNDTLIDTLTYKYDIKSSDKANLFYNKLNDDIAYNKMYTDIEMATTDTVVYLKNNNAAYTRIVIDGIGDWSDSTKSIINKASVLLEFNEPYDSTTLFAPIPSVYVYREIGSLLTGLSGHLDASGNVAPIPHRLTRSGYGYEIVLTSEAQDLYRDEQWDEPIYLVVRSTSNTASPNRVILNSYTNEKPLQFMITYSKY